MFKAILQLSYRIRRVDLLVSRKRLVILKIKEHVQAQCSISRQRWLLFSLIFDAAMSIVVLHTEYKIVTCMADYEQG